MAILSWPPYLGLSDLFPPQSLLELHKRRKALTEPEARYYLRQIVLGCQYLHRNQVIHRDLKLGNLFLNEDLEVKIGEVLGLRVPVPASTRVGKEGKAGRREREVLPSGKEMEGGGLPFLDTLLCLNSVVLNLGCLPKYSLSPSIEPDPQPISFLNRRWGT